MNKKLNDYIVDDKNFEATSDPCQMDLFACDYQIGNGCNATSPRLKANYTFEFDQMSLEDLLLDTRDYTRAEKLLCEEIDKEQQYKMDTYNNYDQAMSILERGKGQK